MHEQGLLRSPLGDQTRPASESCNHSQPDGVEDLHVHHPYTMIRTDPKEILMPRNQPLREERIELRATRAEKRLLAAAAAKQRLDITSFVMSAALPTARAIVARAERIALSARDTRRVLALLENPPKPARRLIEAARRKYRA